MELAKRLVNSSFADKVFFCNSGTEANEGAIKFAHKWARVQAGVDPYDANAQAPHELVSFTNCFHGRTMGALALTYKVRSGSSKWRSWASSCSSGLAGGGGR